MNKKEQYLVFLMILLTTAVTIRVFIEGEYHCENYLILQISAAIVSGLFFGRRREKGNLAFFLSGGALLGIWSYAVTGFNPPLHDFQLAESSLCGKTMASNCSPKPSAAELRCWFRNRVIEMLRS